MKVEGADILSEVTERTSRNLKAISAIVIAIEYFGVKLDNLQVLGVTDLPGELFNLVSLAVIGYLMVVLGVYWRNDYLLWRNGLILSTKNTFDRYIRDLTEGFERYAKERETKDNVKYIRDHFASIKADALDYQRSLAKTTRSVWFVIVVIHLIIPLLLGVGALAALLWWGAAIPHDREGGWPSSLDQPPRTSLVVLAVPGLAYRLAAG